MKNELETNLKNKNKWMTDLGLKVNELKTEEFVFHWVKIEKNRFESGKWRHKNMHHWATAEHWWNWWCPHRWCLVCYARGSQPFGLLVPLSYFSKYLVPPIFFPSKSKYAIIYFVYLHPKGGQTTINKRKKTKINQKLTKNVKKVKNQPKKTILGYPLRQLTSFCMSTSFEE